MSRRHPAGTGDPLLDGRLNELLDEMGVRYNRDLIFDILVAGVGLALDEADRLDLKITSAAVREMRNAFRMFAPYRTAKKVTIFGSARATVTDPLYVQARDLAGELAQRGWMVVTGAGPGIMAAGLEGAGREHSFGVRIRLPSEEHTASSLLADDRHVAMKYFFTRKLMLMKESHAFIALPGGVGTLDEVFELLTLQQTGKARPTPTVLLDVPHGTFWRSWEKFFVDEVLARGFVSPDDRSIFTITDDPRCAVEHVTGFYRNYHSLRWVGDRLVLRLLAAPTDHDLAHLTHQFASLAVDGRLYRTGPLRSEREEHDHVDLPRLALRFDIFRMGSLHRLIAAVNQLPSAPESSAVAGLHSGASQPGAAAVETSPEGTSP